MEVKVDDGHVERKLDVGCLSRASTWSSGNMDERVDSWSPQVGDTDADVGCLVGTTILLASILNSQSASHDSFGNLNKNQFYC